MAALRYQQTHDRYACTEPLSLARFDLQETDDPAVFVLPDVTLATDRPVRQHVRGLGEVRLRLLLQTRKSIKAWSKDGRVQPDGSLPMLGDHGSGGWFTPNSARDNIGRWHNLRVENRGDGDDVHKALVADAHIHTDMAANWLAQGGNFRPESVPGVFRSGTVRDTSIGFEFNANTLTLEDEERQIYRSDDWGPLEGSFVWTGADDTGIGRGEENDMSAELLQQLIDGQKRAAEQQSAMGVRLLTLEEQRVIPEPEPEPEPELVREDAARWEILVEAAKTDMLDDADLLIAGLEGEEGRCKSLSDVILAARAAKRPPGHFHSENNGKERSFDLMRHVPAILMSQNDTVRHLAEDTLKEVPKSLHTAPLSTLIEHFGRHQGFLASNWTARGPMDAFNRFKVDYEPPTQAVHSERLGGLWLPGVGAEYDHNGRFDVEATLRSAAGIAVPADWPALLVATQIASHDGGYMGTSIDVDAWSRRKDQDTLDERFLTRTDVAVPDFSKVAKPGQDLDEAARWHDRLGFTIEEHGFIYAMSLDALVRDGGEALVDTPVRLGEAWGGERSRFVVVQVTGHTYAGVFNLNLSIFDALTSVFTAAFKQIPIARPSTIDTKLPIREPGVTLLPNKLIYGPELETDMSNFFKGRLNDGGRLVGDTSNEDALTDWMVQIGGSREMTPYIKDRNMYLILAGGTWSSLIHGSLQGRPGVQITVTDDISWKRIPEQGIRHLQAFNCQVHQGNTLYRNLVP